MRVKILKSIAGTGDIVAGSRHEFGLDAGTIAEVDDATAVKWIESGIARAVRDAAADSGTTPPDAETSALNRAETASLRRPAGRPRGKA